MTNTAPTLKIDHPVHLAHATQTFLRHAELRFRHRQTHLTTNPSTQFESYTRLRLQAGQWSLLNYCYRVVTTHNDIFLSEVDFLHYKPLIMRQAASADNKNATRQWLPNTLTRHISALIKVQFDLKKCEKNAQKQGKTMTYQHDTTMDWVTQVDSNSSDVQSVSKSQTQKITTKIPKYAKPTVEKEPEMRGLMSGLQARYG